MLSNPRECREIGEKIGPLPKISQAILPPCLTPADRLPMTMFLGIAP
jgi:hypothetical protein